MRESYLAFPPDVRLQTKKEQGFKCAWCGAQGCLQVHHVVPQSIARDLGYSEKKIISRENAVALCEGEGKCHETFDILALKFNSFYDDVAQDHGREVIGAEKPPTKLPTRYSQRRTTSRGGALYK